jgi:pyruvate dehydrogenase E2 component (dihydrolipoamide acetyltransferase)
MLTVMPDIQLLRVPKWGLSMEEGTIALWLIEEGDSFFEGQEICEIETSKIANVMEAPFAGRLHRILAQPGDTLPVQAVIGVVAPAGVDDSAVDAALAAEGVVSASPSYPSSANQEIAPLSLQTAHQDARLVPLAEHVGPASSSVEIPESLRGVASEEVFASPRAQKCAQDYGIDLRQIRGSGRLGRVSMQDIRSAVWGADGRFPSSPNLLRAAVYTGGLDDAEIAATPIARRLAKSWGIRLGVCRATGRNGRVCKADVEAVRAKTGGIMLEKDSSAVSDGQKPGESHFNSSVTVSMTAMRKTIAARLSKSKQDSPHFRVAIDAQVDALNALRRQVNAEHPGVKVSLNDFVIKAVAMALVRHPECNIQFDGNQISQFEHADVSVAVAVEHGLITPIVRSADTKSLVTISSEMRDLVMKAKASKLSVDEFQGGTFTISNLGMFGVTHFDAIINPPQAAILAVGGVREEMRYRDGEPACISLICLNLASDHRVIDGVLAAEFLRTVKLNLESPALMLAGQPL